MHRCIDSPMFILHIVDRVVEIKCSRNSSYLFDYKIVFVHIYLITYLFKQNWSSQYSTWKLKILNTVPMEKKILGSVSTKHYC